MGQSWGIVSLAGYGRRGRLAEILLLDQIPRNISRVDCPSFATDYMASVLAQEGLEQALDLPVVTKEWIFLHAFYAF
ncbi:MAG: DUF924 family protein [Streptococcus parasanguinis]